jgi:predicted membrane protein
VFQVLVLVAGLKNIIEQLDQGTRKEVQVSRCSKEIGLGQNNHRGAQNTSVSAYVLLFFFLFFLIFVLVVVFFKYFFIFLSFVESHKKETHQVLVFLCKDASSGISTSLPKNQNKCLENEKSYFQAEFGDFKNSESGKLERIGCEI